MVHTQDCRRRHYGDTHHSDPRGRLICVSADGLGGSKDNGHRTAEANQDRDEGRDDNRCPHNSIPRLDPKLYIGYK